MDITICVMLPTRGATDYSSSSHPKWRVLEPVAVMPMGDTSQQIGAPRTGYIHVLGIPGRSSLRGSKEHVIAQIGSKLCAQNEENVAGGTEPISVKKTKRLWDASGLSAEQRAALLVDRQITLTWAQFKNALRHSRESRALTDTDLD